MKSLRLIRKNFIQNHFKNVEEEKLEVRTSEDESNGIGSRRCRGEVGRSEENERLATGSTRVVFTMERFKDVAIERSSSDDYEAQAN